jgi:hypothetical protein
VVSSVRLLDSARLGSDEDEPARKGLVFSISFSADEVLCEWYER